MCDLNGPFRLCSCSSKINYDQPHWILHMNSTNEGEDVMVIIGMMTPLNLIDKIERRKILRRLNTINVFDFDYKPIENDQLELNLSDGNGYKFTFKKDKWVIEEWYGEHPIFEHQTSKEGVIDSHPSELKEVHTRYLEVIDKNEEDITMCGWSNYRIAEKDLIKILKKRINGEKIEFPDGYHPWG